MRAGSNLAGKKASGKGFLTSTPESSRQASRPRVAMQLLVPVPVFHAACCWYWYEIVFGGEQRSIRAATRTSSMPRPQYPVPALLP